MSSPPMSSLPLSLPPMSSLAPSHPQSLESDLSDARQGLREAKKLEAAAKEAASILKANLDVNVALVARLESDLETHLQGSG